MNNTDALIKKLADTLSSSESKKPKAYDTQAEVKRVDGDTAWVHIPGGVDETPVQLTTSAKKGDIVQVRVSGGKAWLYGNQTNPPTDDTRANEVGILAGPSIDFVKELEGKDVTVQSITAATGYIKDLTADNITAQDISASSGYIKELEADNITAQNISADHATIEDLDANYAQIDAANITDLTAQNAWVNKVMVQTGLIAHESNIFTLDAIQVNAANITAGTIDVNRLIVTVDGQKYLVNINPSTGTPTYEKMDGNIVEPRTITADKIVAHDITVQEITTENLVGTNGWINLNQGKFFYGNGASYATATNAIEWNGTTLRIKGDIGDSVVFNNYSTTTEMNTAIGNAVDGIEVGGRNLLLKTAQSAVSNKAVTAGSYAVTDFYDMISAYSALGLTTDDYVTVSFDWSVTGVPSGTVTAKYGTNTSPWEFFGLLTTFSAGSSSGHVEKTFKVTSALASSTGSKLRVRVDSSVAITAGAMVLTITNAKLEKGNKATDWSPAPEDVDSAISNVNETATAAYNRKSAYTGTGSRTNGALSSTISGFSLERGAVVSLYFGYSCNYTDALTLNINETGAKPVWVGDLVTSDTNRLMWHWGTTLTFCYDGTNWRLLDTPPTYYGTTCSVSAGTASKATTIPSGMIFRGTVLEVPMTNANTATTDNPSAPYLSINNTASSASSLTGTILYGTGSIIPTVANGYSWLAGMSVIFKYDGKFWRTGNQTVIDGANILTGNINADRIKTNVVYAINATANKIDAKNINASQLVVGDFSENLQEAFDNSEIEVGGKNLLAGTQYMYAGTGSYVQKTFRADNHGTLSHYVYTDLPHKELTGAIRVTNTEGSTYQCGFFQTGVPMYVKSETPLTVSFWIRASAANLDIKTHALWYNSGPQGTTTASGKTTTEWQKITHTTTVSTDILATVTAGLIHVTNLPNNAWFEIAGLKLEIGNTATDWSDDIPTEGTNYFGSGDCATSLDGLTQSTNKFSITTKNGYKCAHITGALATKGQLQSQYSYTPQKYQMVSMSCDMRLDNYVAGSTNPLIGLYYGGATPTGSSSWFGPKWLNQTFNGNKQYINSGNIATYINNKGWVHIESTAIWYDDYSTTIPAGYVYARDFTGELYVRNIKFEFGHKCTQWSPYPLNEKATNAAKTATSYITKITDAGIFISPSNQSPTTNAAGNSIKIDGTGMNVYNGGVSIAEYGTAARIGKASGQHVSIQNTALEIYKGAESTAANKMAVFGDGTAQIGPTANSKTRAVINTNGMKILTRDSNGVDTQIVNLGYGSGVTDTGSTGDAPYFSLGARYSGSGIGNYSIAGGYKTIADKFGTVALGSSSDYVTKNYFSSINQIPPSSGEYTLEASSSNAFAEGDCTKATGGSSHAEGGGSIASGEYSHAEGKGTKATGHRSHSEGSETLASGANSHAQNWGTIAASDYQTAIGKCNKSDASNTYLFIIGNGSASARSDAFTVDKNGNVNMAGECFSRTSKLQLGSYVASALLTSSGKSLSFSIPTGRVYPSGTTITSIQFSMVGRASSSYNSHSGYYIVKGSSGGTGAAAFDSSVSNNTFWNADDKGKTPTTAMWTKTLYGGTNVYIQITGDVNYYFSGTSTINNYVNNNSCTVYLTNIVVNLNVPSM